MRLVKGWKCLKCKEAFKVLKNGNGKCLISATICPNCKEQKTLRIIFQEILPDEMPVPYRIQSQADDNDIVDSSSLLRLSLSLKTPETIGCL